MNPNKSAAYKNLVARAQARYPEYRDDVKPSTADKQITRDFAATFDDKQAFLNALKSMGITWNECFTNTGINVMRAKMALSKAVACGFEPAAKFAKLSALYGAIVGDIVGSCYVRKNQAIKTKDFEFFGASCHFTAATVMTIAVADALLFDFDFYKRIGLDILDLGYRTEKDMCFFLQSWGHKYPNAGYGQMFKAWLASDNPQPYNSYGNGAAMRVSPCAWVHDSLDWTDALAWRSAQYTHGDFNSEGLKGAEAVASAIFLARTGYSKADIKFYIESAFGYDLSRTIEEIRPGYRYENAAEKSVPEAIIAFLEAENFEDAVRNAVSLGGAANTQAAIAGSIAEAFFGVPDEFKAVVRSKLTPDMLDVLDKFNAALGFKVPRKI